MKLKQLLLTVDEARLIDSELYQTLRNVKPEYGSNLRISVKRNGDGVRVTNVHVGTFGDIEAGTLEVEKDLHLTNEQLLEEILTEMSRETFSETELEEAWDENKDISKAKIVM